MQVVILGRGVDTTPDVTADSRPKCLWPIGDRACAQYLLEHLQSAGASSFIFCLTPPAEGIESRLQKELGARYDVSCVVQEQILGTAGALKAVADQLTGTFMVAHGGIVVDGDIRALLATHREARAAMTIGGVRPFTYPSYIEEILRDENGRVVGFQAPHRSERERTHLYPCGLYVLEPECLDEIPEARYFDVKEQLIPGLASRALTVVSHEMDGYWREIHFLSDYFQLNMDVLLGHVRTPLAPSGKHPGETIERRGRVTVDETARLAGPIVLGADCEVEAGAQLFGPCVVGEGSCVRSGAVVSNSVLLAGAEVGSGAYVHDAILAEKVSVPPEERVLGVAVLPHGRRPLRQEACPLLPPGVDGPGIWHRRAKRAVDVAVSAVGLVLAAPLMAFVAVMVKLTSRGPIIFRDYRCTIGGRRFPMFKFRTMVENADKLKAELMTCNESDGPMFKMSEDPRLTPVGGILRKTSLDELPQLANVLRGEMSLVGPRPLSMQEMHLHRAWRDRRLTVLPGLTGLWQATPDNKNFHTWISADMAYVRDMSLWQDLWIVIRTFFTIVRNFVVRGRGGAALAEAGVVSRTGAATERCMPILCYHAVEDSDPEKDPYGIDVNPRRFARQMNWMAETGRRCVSLDELVFGEAAGRNGYEVAITFDDAYNSVIAEAYPVLEEMGFKATVFVVTNRVGTTGTWEQEESCGRRRTFLDWDDIRRLGDAGWTIGSHTVTHRRLIDLSDEELREELAESKRQIEDATGHEVRFLSYPAGIVDERVEAAAREAGYSFAASLWRPPGKGDMYLRRREIKRRFGMQRFRIEMLLSAPPWARSRRG